MDVDLQARGAYRHIPVMLNQVLDYLITDKDGIYVDVTFGQGGHTKAILRSLSMNATVFAMDVDKRALKYVPDDNRLIFVRHNFRYMQFFLEYLGLLPVSGILADLGVSSEHIDSPEAGFTFRKPAPLDMRMDQDIPIPASEFLRHVSETQLERIFREYGEIENARVLARAIVSSRRKQIFSTTTDLVSIVRRYAMGNPKRYLARTFQAIRIAINDELESLRRLLIQAERVLKTGGRLLVITFHSLEDRLVKNYVRESKCMREHPDSPVLPDPEEVKVNPRARSAKLRILEKVCEHEGQ